MEKTTEIPWVWDCEQVREGLRQPGRVSCDLEGTECTHLSVDPGWSPRFAVSHLCALKKIHDAL